MAKKVPPLTATKVANAKPKQQQYALFDGGGLRLVIKPTGSKLWRFDYKRPYTKKAASISFGIYPDVSLEQAKKKRESARALLAQDIDPKHHKDERDREHAEAATNTLQAIALSWLTVKKTTTTPKTATEAYRRIEIHALPQLGAIPAHKIRAPIVIEALRPLEAKGSLETLKRVCQVLNEVMNFAVNSGVVDSNPLTKIYAVFSKPTKQHFSTLRPCELGELMRTLAAANIKRTTRCLIEWQLHTMVRPSEAAGTRWSEIDIEGKAWTIPPERMKRKKPHTVPLTPQTLALLEVMRPISGHREHLFPGDRNPRAHTNEQTANMALKRMGFKDLLVAHGMRSLASTTLNEQAFDYDVIESCLAHTDTNQVRAAYNRTDYLERRRVVMEWWSNHIEQNAQGNLSMTGSIRGLRAIS